MFNNDTQNETFFHSFIYFLLLNHKLNEKQLSAIIAFLLLNMRLCDFINLDKKINSCTFFIKNVNDCMINIIH